MFFPVFYLTFNSAYSVEHVVSFQFHLLMFISLVMPKSFKKHSQLTFRQNQSGIMHPPSDVLQPAGTVVDCEHGCHIRQESLK